MWQCIRQTRAIVFLVKDARNVRTVGEPGHAQETEIETAREAGTPRQGQRLHFVTITSLHFFIASHLKGSTFRIILYF